MTTSEIVVACVFLIGLPCLLAVFTKFAISLYKFAQSQNKLKSEVRVAAPEIYQSIWSFNALGNNLQRLSNFLENNSLDNNYSVRAKKDDCHKALKEFRTSFAFFLLFILLAVLVGGFVSIVQTY